MSQPLRADSPIMQKLHMLGELMVLNMLVLLCSLPIFTVGAAVSAMYDAVWRIKNSRGQLVRDYLKAFRNNFRKSTLLWIPVLLTGLLLAYSTMLLLMNPDTGIGQLKLPLILGFAFWVMTVSWLFPLQSRFENSLRHTLFNAILCSFRFFPRTLLMCLINLIPWLLLLFNTHLFLWFGTLWVFVWMSMAAYWNICILDKPFSQLIALLDTSAQSEEENQP